MAMEGNTLKLSYSNSGGSGSSIDHNNTSDNNAIMDIINGSVKRKRSDSTENSVAAGSGTGTGDGSGLGQGAGSASAAAPSAPSGLGSSSSAPPAKMSKTHGSHLQINYLARQYSEILPLVSADDTMPTVLQTLSDYSGVLERHESLAGNLGARPLGPILIKRFERLFDGAPRVLKSHGKEGTTVTWLDVVEFARHKPEQFNLEKMRDGVRVCQFYTKQSRVEISEEDFLLISSGMPQKLIPPQPIAEDEEKELGTLEIMEKSVAQVIQLADQALLQHPARDAYLVVPTKYSFHFLFPHEFRSTCFPQLSLSSQLIRLVSARARQTKHRLTARRNAIANRRAAEAEANNASAANERPNSAGGGGGNGGESPSGFTAVNNNKTLTNGTPSSKMIYTGSTASTTTRAELIHCFSQQRERMNDASGNGAGVVGNSSGVEYATPNSLTTGRTKTKSKHGGGGGSDGIDYAALLLNSASPVPIPNKSSYYVDAGSGGSGGKSTSERYDDSGPYKAEMLSRMDSMQRGDRVMPPCDRCRRLHMDCLKNLTACLGCTKKHAKCSWKEVTEEELRRFGNGRGVGGKKSSSGGAGVSGSGLGGTANLADGDDAEDDEDDEGDPDPVRDEELLGDDSEDEDTEATATGAMATAGGETSVAEGGSSFTESSAANPSASNLARRERDDPGEVNVIKPVSRPAATSNDDEDDEVDTRSPFRNGSAAPANSAGGAAASSSAPAPASPPGGVVAVPGMHQKEVQQAAEQIIKKRLGFDGVVDEEGKGEEKKAEAARNESTENAERDAGGDAMTGVERTGDNGDRERERDSENRSSGFRSVNGVGA